MTRITNAQAAKINKMNKAAQAIAMGTRLQTLESSAAYSGSVASAGSQVILNLMGAGTSASGVLFQVLRSGSVITNQMKMVSGSVAGQYVITAGSGFAPLATTTDIVTYIAF